MRSVLIGPSYSISPHGFGDHEIFNGLLENKSPLDDVNSVLDGALKNQVAGRIPWDRFETFPIQNTCVKNGPVEARFAYLTASKVLEYEGLAAYMEGPDSTLYVGTMNNLYGLVGLRNGYRICANENLAYDKKTFERQIGTGYSYVHPMVPVYKIPNNVIANVALDYKIHGENANFFGEDSGAVALQEGYLKIRNELTKCALIINSNHLFINYLTFMFLEIHNFARRSQDGINPESSSFYFPSEWASSFLLIDEQEASKQSIEPQARILASRQISYVEPYFSRVLPESTLDRIVNKVLADGGLKWSDLDLIVTDNLAYPRTSLKFFERLNQHSKRDIPILCPTLLTGHSICSSASSHLSIALEILRNQRVFSSYLKGQVPDSPILTSGVHNLRVGRVGILTQGLNNSIQFMIIEKI